MTVRVAIRDNRSGETRVYTNPDDTWWRHSEFFWTEGNFACDCNRDLVFKWAAGIDTDQEDEDDDEPCGDDHYSILWVDPKGNGERYWIEGENELNLPPLPAEDHWPEYS